jgi:DNA-binding beta-propeller fold protein YncE
MITIFIKMRLSLSLYYSIKGGAFMGRILALLLLVSVGFMQTGCGSSNSPTTSKSSSSSSSPSFTYPFLTNFGHYMEYGTVTNPNTGCGGTIPEAGGFYDVTGVAVGDGYIFVADYDEEDIEVFDMNGNYITFFWPYDTRGDYDDYPEGMKVANGKLYVADDENGYIDVYNIPDIIGQAAQPDMCNEVYAYGSYWTSNMDDPSDVDVDANGKIYVSDWDYSRIYVFNPDFNDGTEPNWGDDVITSTNTGVTAVDGGNLNDPSGIAVDPAGKHVYVGDYDNNVVQVYSFDGTTLTSTGAIGDAAGAASTVAGKFDGPWGIRVDNQGNLMVADTNNGRVQRLTTSGSVLNIIGGNPLVAGGLYSPDYLAVGSDDKLYVTDNNYATVDVYSAQ